MAQIQAGCPSRPVWCFPGLRDGLQQSCDKPKKLCTRQISREINTRLIFLWITLLKYPCADRDQNYHTLSVGLGDWLTKFFYLYLSLSYVLFAVHVADSRKILCYGVCFPHCVHKCLLRFQACGQAGFGSRGIYPQFLLKELSYPPQFFDVIEKIYYLEAACTVGFLLAACAAAHERSRFRYDLEPFAGAVAAFLCCCFPGGVPGPGCALPCRCAGLRFPLGPQAPPVSDQASRPLPFLLDPCP